MRQQFGLTSQLFSSQGNFYGWPGFGFGFGYYPYYEYQSPIAYHPHTYLHPHYYPGDHGYDHGSSYVLHPHTYLHPHPVKKYY